MKPELMIVRYGEIGLKAKVTRRYFENTLVKNIKDALKKEKISFEIGRQRGRIYVYTNQIKQCLMVLQKIFGITSISPAVKTKSNVESMQKLALTLCKNKISKETSFALKVTRTGNHNFSSRDVAVILGEAIVNKTQASVNLTQPDVKLNIEIRDKDAFFYFEKIKGTGGLPVGSQGKILAIIDSKKAILAAWYLMRRGCIPFFAIIDESLVNKVKMFTKKWYVKDLIEQTNLDEIEGIADKLSCDAIVTGYTVDELTRIKKIKIPILYPLIGLEDDEINNKMMEIDL